MAPRRTAWIALVRGRVVDLCSMAAIWEGRITTHPNAT
jgi:hypothetical protein